MADIVVEAEPPSVQAARWLRDASRDLRPGGQVAITYHPLSYAWPSHEAYLRRYVAGPKRALMVGMNPGPWGMGQTGIPFGDVGLAGDWMGLRGTEIGQPERTHPKRPVQGWECRRGEQSGRRLWGYLKERFGTAERALQDLAIANHCPLLLFGETGTNITPDKLRKADREVVFEVCDDGIRRMADAVDAEVLIGIGNYAEERCQLIADSMDRDLEILKILHPSPASPLANRDGGAYWRANVDETLAAAGVV